MSFWNELSESKKKCLLQFGGQGSDFKEELKYLFRFDELRSFFRFCFDVISNEVRKDVFLSSGFLNQGFDLLNWLEQDCFPDQNYLGRSIISVPAIFILQVGYWHLLGIRNKHDQILDLSHAAIGHSQGIYPAIFLSLCSNDKSYYNNLQQMLLYTLNIGRIFDCAYTSQSLSCEEMELSLHIDGQKPKPMALIGGLDLPNLDKLLDTFNEGKRVEDKIFKSLINNNSLQVIGGRERTMLQFRYEYFKEFEREGISWRYLEFSAPFHTPHMSKAKDEYDRCVRELDLCIKGTDLRIPVYDTHDGSCLNYQQDLMNILFDIIFCSTVDWPLCITSALGNQCLSCVIDFGPGVASSYMTRFIVSDTKMQFLTAARKRDLRRLLD